jgi:hypothetical protein
MTRSSMTRYVWREVPYSTGKRDANCVQRTESNSSLLKKKRFRKGQASGRLDWEGTIAMMMSPLF